MSNIISNIPNIFIVDDDATMRLLMVDALEEDGYTIAEYSNGKDAMDAIEKKQPDMVLLDVKMPIMNGFDVCSRIREKYGDINTSIVMVTGLDDSDSIEKSFQLGATAFISKPINWITFPHVIRYLLKARSAFVDLKSREVHLEHMDEISRIITQNKPRNIVLQESIHALLGIFHADSAIIISATGINRPNIDISFEASKETLTDHSICARNLEYMLAEDILNRARNSEYPIIFSSTKQQDSSAALYSSLYSCMIKHLHTDDDRSWYLTVLKCDDQNVWSSLEQETFYRSGIRLGGVLSQHLLMERLHRSEHLLRQAQHIGHLGNWSLNVANRQLTWSEEMFLIYGYNPERFTPTYEHFYKINFEEDNARITKFEQTDFASGETFNIEHRILLPTGETRWVHEQAVGLLDESGLLIEVNGTVQDITERLKKQEQELHDNKMEAIGKLTSGIAHDFGNLMTIAKGNLDLLQEILPEQYIISAGDMEILDDANSAIQDGVELTKQLLTFSRKKSTAPEKICIKHTLDKFNKLIKNTLGAKITLSIHVQNDLPDILVDSALFVSSLINIIINARDAMPGGGDVSISATQDQSLSENRVSISIDDTGTGMTDHVYQHALEPFFTTKDEGTGLGLSMAYGFMKQSGGNLSIETRPGHGTRVLMNFPAYTGAGPAQSEGTLFNMQIPHNKTILVVEDNPAVRQLAVRCLSRLGFTIFESENATNAMDMLSENPNIELLFTDILMPGEMNGRELAEWALGQFPGLKIVLTTAAKKEALDLLHARDSSFQFLLKPYSKHDLIQKILMFLKDD
jgi:CheY-like chemotaxis protein/signal transduction histidine kinase